MAAPKTFADLFGRENFIKMRESLAAKGNLRDDADGPDDLLEGSRFEEGIKRLLNTPPMPIKEMTKKSTKGAQRVQRKQFGSVEVDRK